MRYWRAPGGCPRHLRDPLERAVNAYPVAFLSLPTSGEIFESIEECERRLIAYSLSQGFDIVRTSGGQQRNPGVTWQCVFHGEGTRNWRNLEKEVVKDEEGNIVSRRQRNTAVHQSGCKWRVSVSFKSIGKRGGSEKAYILGIRSIEHLGHSLSENPLIFPGHRSRLEEFKRLKEQARNHRLTIIPYSISRRVLKSKEIGLTLTLKEYYNTVRH